MSLDFFTLPTATFRVLFVFIVLRHDRRRIVHFNVTEHPSAEWTAQQMVDAFPWDTAPRYLVRDRDQTYGAYFDTRVDGVVSKNTNELKTRTPPISSLVRGDAVRRLMETKSERGSSSGLAYSVICLTALRRGHAAPPNRPVGLSPPPVAQGSDASPAARNALDSVRIPRASKLLICGLLQKGRVLAQDGHLVR